MRLTAQFKEWLIANCGVKADATDDEFRKAAGEALATGTLSAEKFQELQTDSKAAEANEFARKLDAVSENLAKLAEVLTKSVTREPEQPTETKAAAPVEEKAAETQTATKAGADEHADWYTKMVSGLSHDEQQEEKAAQPNVRVKGAWERYDTTRKSMTYPQMSRKGTPHPLAGTPVRDFGRAIDEPSELDKAVAGVWGKFLILTAMHGKIPRFGYEALPQHDKELLRYAMDKMLWDDSEDHKRRERKLTPREQKAIIDDATSGGTEAAPIAFDDIVISAPLLHGELFPLVNTVPIARGRRIEGVATGTITGAWGGVDDTSISLFNTTSYVTAFDTTIFRWQSSIQIGRDFLEDTPIDFTTHVINQIGERLLEDLDDVIATGNGSTQPEGVINGGGASTSFASGTTIGNYEDLIFNVAKAEHRGPVGNTAVICANETTYQRARGIRVGSSDDRRLFGQGNFGTDGYKQYTLMGIPYKINESLTNSQLFYAILGRYRMYRRKGLAISTSTEGDTLMRKNELLIVAMARYGGQMERAAASTVVTDAPA